jgi:hypothetical protein
MSHKEKSPVHLGHRTTITALVQAVVLFSHHGVKTRWGLPLGGRLKRREQGVGIGRHPLQIQSHGEQQPGNELSWVRVQEGDTCIITASCCPLTPGMSHVANVPPRSWH